MRELSQCTGQVQQGKRSSKPAQMQKKFLVSTDGTAGTASARTGSPQVRRWGAPEVEGAVTQAMTLALLSKPLQSWGPVWTIAGPSSPSELVSQNGVSDLEAFETKSHPQCTQPPLTRCDTEAKGLFSSHLKPLSRPAATVPVGCSSSGSRVQSSTWQVSSSVPLVLCKVCWDHPTTCISQGVGGK